MVACSPLGGCEMGAGSAGREEKEGWPDRTVCLKNEKRDAGGVFHTKIWGKTRPVPGGARSPLRGTGRRWLFGFPGRGGGLFPKEGKLLRHRVIAALVEGMAFQNPSYTEVKPLKRTVFSYRLIGILRACRCKTACRHKMR